MTLATLSEAIDWVSGRWDGQKPVPLRLHIRGTDGALGGMPFSHQMEVTLDMPLTATTRSAVRESCSHIARVTGGICPMCCIYDDKGQPMAESGIYEREVDRYRWPMSIALTKLRNTLRPRRLPHPYRLVLALADHGWDAHSTARSLDMHYDLAEPLLLQAIRKLHGRYEEGPVGWINKSDSQRNAESWSAA